MSTGVPAQRTAYRIDKAGDFILGFLPAGQYELRVTRIAAADKAAAPDTSSKKAPEEARASSITITLDGVKAGPLKKALALITSSTGADTVSRGSGGAITTVHKESDAKTFHPGRPIFGNITFETDGKREVKGTVQYTAAINSIINN